LEAISAWFFWNLEQQCLAAQFDRIHTAISIAIQEGKSRAIFSDNGDATFAPQGLHCVGRIVRRTTHVDGLRRGDTRNKKQRGEYRQSRASNRFHNNASWSEFDGADLGSPGAAIVPR